MKKLFEKIFKRKNKSIKEDKIIRAFYNETKLEKIFIIENSFGSYSYVKEKYYYFDEEERIYINEEGYWVQNGSNTGLFASEELVLNELKDVLVGYTEVKLEEEKNENNEI